MSNGKGDSPRNCFSQAFRDNFDSINWEKQTLGTCRQLPMNSKATKSTKPKQIKARRMWTDGRLLNGPLGCGLRKHPISCPPDTSRAVLTSLGITPAKKGRK